MQGARTRGQPAALAAVGSMIRGGAPHAVLLVGPAGIGKTTLALDLAAGLLCTAADAADRPCGACRACRLVASGGHPDVHRIGPEGPGRQVVIGGPGRARGVRDLIGELALLPVEGGARIAIIDAAHRMNEDAQAALLKTLEEPPAGVSLILCADAEEPLLRTIRSRCARLRLGPVGIREIESILDERGVADAPLAARLARIAAGRPGVALAWARQPDALRARDELSRSLLDLLDARPAERLAGVRAAALRAASLTAVDDRATGDAAPSAASAPPDATEAGDPGTDAGDDVGGPTTRTPAAERRRAAEALIALWTDVARDLALARRGLDRSVRDLGLLDETAAAAARLDAGDLDAFLDRLGGATVLIAGNVSPELLLDDLALAWPRPRADRRMTAQDADAGGAARLEAIARGRVQGVGFRYFVLRRGMELGLTGWVANEPDGSVRLVAEGSRGELEALLETMQRGPAGAIVERVSATWSAATGTLRDFGIRAGGHSGD